MKKNYYSRKRRQFNRITKKLDFLLKNKLQNASEIKLVKTKFQDLFLELKSIFGNVFLKKSLVKFAFVFPLSFGGIALAQSFAPVVTSPFNLPTLESGSKCAIQDIDGDGDKDIMTIAISNGNRVVTFVENIGNSSTPNFGTPINSPFGLQVIDGTLDGADGFSNMAMCDIDNDGDFDFFYGIADGLAGHILFSENIGNATTPNFATFEIDPFNISFSNFGTIWLAAPTFIDINNDGDLDMFVGNHTGSVIYFKNIGTPTAPDFVLGIDNAMSINTTNTVSSPAFSDLDKDGDFDLLIGTYDNNVQFEYFENIGSAIQASFTSAIINPFGLGHADGVNLPSNFADMDNDGDDDLFTFYYGNQTEYYENISDLSSIKKMENAVLEVKLYPNPVKDKLTLNVTSKTNLSKIKIISVNGTVLMTINEKFDLIDMSNFESGVYFLEFIDITGNKTVSKIEKI